MVGSYEGYHGGASGYVSGGDTIARSILHGINCDHMQIEKYKISEHNQSLQKEHQRKFEFIAEGIRNTESILQKLIDFQIAIPSWALGTGGTRFGRFSGGGEPRSLEEKMEDIGLLHALNRSSGAISLHIPWDIPKDAAAIKSLAVQHGLRFDAMNSNTFQDQPGQKHSYKFGSLTHPDKPVRDQAVAHNIECIEIGKMLGSKAHTVWIGDGGNFPGQQHFRHALERYLESMRDIYDALPDDWRMFIEHKFYEPAFYSTVINDWGTSYYCARELGPKAFCLVDL